MMKTENRIFISYGGKKWVMWPNNNFGVFEIKWGLGYELWVLSLSLSYELWKLSHGQTKHAFIIKTTVEK